MERKHEGDEASSPEILRKLLTLEKNRTHKDTTIIRILKRNHETVPLCHKGAKRGKGGWRRRGKAGRREGERRGGERGRRGDGKKREGGKRRVRGEGPHSCVTFVAPHVDVSPNAVAMPVSLRMETSTRMDVATSLHHTPFGPQTTEKKRYEDWLACCCGRVYP